MKIITNMFLLLIPDRVQCAERPNIVFILSDDIGTGDIKCYYEPSKVTTPNIDKLATQGMRFTQAYVIRCSLFAFTLYFYHRILPLSRTIKG